MSATSCPDERVSPFQVLVPGEIKNKAKKRKKGKIKSHI